MSTTIDSLQIEIQTSSSNAAGGIDRLAASLERLKKVGSFNVAIKNLNNLSTSLKNLQGVSNAGNNLQNLATAINTLKSAGSFGSIATSFKKLSESLNGLDSSDIDVFVAKVKELDDKLGPVSKKLVEVGKAVKTVNTATKGASSSMGGLGSKVNATTLNMSSLVTVARGLISTLRPIINLISNSISEALEWDGVSARFARGFGEQAQDTYAWIQKLNKEMSINVQQFMQYSSTYATMLKGFGVASEDASKMALGYMELTYDVWSGYNDIYKSLDDAATAVRSAIAGEVEPVRKAGFTIIESTLKQTAANHGLKISLEKATEAQKSYLRYLTLVDQAKAQGLVGNYARELNTAEGVMRTFNQQLKSLAQSFGSLLLPVLVKTMPYIQAFVELMGDAIRAVATFFGVEIQEIDFGSSGLDGITDSANSATEAVKELKNATTGIDELNILSPQSGGAGSSSGGGFDGLDVDSLWDESIFDNIQSDVDAIKESLKDWMPVIEAAGIALGLLGAAKLLSDLTTAVEKMDVLSQAIFGIGTALIEASLVFVFADNYLEEGNLLSLFGEAMATALGGYALYKTWGAKGLAIGIAVSIAAQLSAITLNLATGGVEIDDPELWIQSAFTALAGAVGGGLILKKVFTTMPNSALGKGMLFSAFAALSLTLAAITIGGVAADGDLGFTEAITGILSTVLGGASGAGLCTFLGIASGGTGFLIGAAIMLAVNVVGAIVATKANLKDEMAAEIAEIFAGSGEFTLEDVSVEIGVKLSAITENFGEFEQYRGIIDGAQKSIGNVTTEIDNMAGAIEKGSGAFDEYVPKIIADIATLESETRTKLEAIRENLISALAGGLGEGYKNVDEYIDTVNGVIGDTMTRLDELEVILGDSAKMGSKEWANAWAEYKTLIGEATNLTEDFSGMVGSIDWSALTTADGKLDGGALKTYFSDISTAMGETKKEIETYYSGIDSDLRTLRDNAVNLYGKDSEAVVKLDSLIDTNQANWDSALGEVNTIAQSAFDQLQRDVMYKAEEVVTEAQDEYKNMSWWEKLMYPNEEAYVNECLSTFRSDYIDPISTEMSGVFEELGIDGSEWSSDAMQTITDALFDTETHKGKSNIKVKTFEYKNSVAGAIIEALNGAGQDAKPYALQVAASVGLNLGNGLGNQYSLIYDKTTGAVTGIKDATTGTVTAITPDLKAAMKELGIDMSDGVIKGAESEMKANKKKWTDWAIWPWNWFKKKNEINSPSKLFQRGGKYLTDGLSKGMSLTSLRDKLSSIWSTAKTWWDTKKGNLSTYVPSIGDIKSKLSSAWSTAKTWWDKAKSKLATYTPSIGSIKDKVSSAWTSAKTWWNNTKTALSTYTPSIGSIKDKLSSAWDTAKTWWNNHVKLSIPSLSFNVTYTPKSSLGIVKKAIVNALGLSGWPKLSFAANGGIFDAGSLVWAGERGPEIVANAGGGKTGVMNVQQMSEAVYEGVYSAVVAAMRASGGNGGSQSVNVYLDGKQITSSVEQRQKERGASLMGNQVYAY